MGTMKQVSICTLTHNRKEYLRLLQGCIEKQSYPLSKIEWVILDDSNSYGDSLDLYTNTDLRIKYQRLRSKLSLGAKRNLAHRLCSGDIIVYMDDDDYYFPDRISHAVSVLEATKSEIVGSTVLHIYYSHDDSLWISGPFGGNHATAGTFAMTKNFALSHHYDNDASCNEEKSFLENYTIPIAQLNPLKTMICISHEHNTFDKKKMRASGKTARMKPISNEEGKRLLKALTNSGHRKLEPIADAQEKATPQEIALVCGPWGSGTTALCKVISMLGINTPGPYFQTNDPRTPNSFEMLEFNQLVNRCVNENDLTRKVSTQEILNHLGSFAKTQNLYPRDEISALKTPASSAILDELDQYFNLRLIICLRNYDLIEASRKRRGWPEQYGIQGAKIIYSQINEYIASNETPFLFIRHSDLTHHLRVRHTVEKIIEFLNLSPSPEAINNAVASVRINQATNKHAPKLRR